MEIAIEIDAPAEEVWNLLVDTERWAEWGPSVRAVDCPERHIRAGTVGRIRTPLGIWVPFTITDFDPPRQWRWRVAGGACNRPPSRVSRRRAHEAGL